MESNLTSMSVELKRSKKMLKDKTVAVIGVGKMGGTLINSVIKNGLIKKENLFGSTAQEKHAKVISR